MTISDIPEETLREYIAGSKTYKEILQKCGYNNCGCSTYLKKRINACNIDVSHIKTKTKVSNDFVKYKLSEILVCDSTYSSMVQLKSRLIKELGWVASCSVCSLSKWMDKSIPLEIDHINGIHNDNRVENLRFICPNCHAQTDTYKGKNKKTYIERGCVKEHGNCIDCNMMITNKGTRCLKCNALFNRRAERPTHEQMTEYRKTMTLEQIGKQYNVGRASIQRWIKSYDKKHQTK